MNAIEIVTVQPVVFASPAGFSDSASPSSADATAAPARDVDVAPEPGRNNPPACACDASSEPTTPPTTASFPSFISPRTYITTRRECGTDAAKTEGRREPRSGGPLASRGKHRRCVPRVTSELSLI